MGPSPMGHNDPPPPSGPRESTPRSRLACDSPAPSSQELAINTQRPPPRASRFFWPFSPSSEPQFKHDDVLIAHPSTVDGGTNAHPHWPRDSTDDQRFHSNQRVEVDFRREKMASWSGQPSVRGNSETTRMVLLTFSAIGVACVPVHLHV